MLECGYNLEREQSVATPRNNIVRLRLTELERQDWALVAGGKGKLSEWIRATCNAAAEKARIETQGPPQPETEDLALSDARAVKRAEAKQLVATLGPDASVGAYERHKAAVENLGSSAGEETRLSERLKEEQDATLGRTAKVSLSCSRERHHRSGTYCGACKKVIA